MTSHEGADHACCCHLCEAVQNLNPELHRRHRSEVPQGIRLLLERGDPMKTVMVRTLIAAACLAPLGAFSARAAEAAKRLEVPGLPGVVAFSQDGKRLAVAGELQTECDDDARGFLRVWDVGTWLPRVEVELPLSPTHAVFAPQREAVAVLGARCSLQSREVGCLAVWRYNPDRLEIMRETAGPLAGLAFAGDVLLTGNLPCCSWLGGEPAATTRPLATAPPDAIPSRDLLLAWDLARLEPQARVAGQSLATSFFAIKTSPDGACLVSGSIVTWKGERYPSGELVAWDSRSRKQLYRVQTDAMLTDYAFAAETKSLWTAEQPRVGAAQIVERSLADGQPLQRLVDDDRAMHLAVTPDNAYLIAAGPYPPPPDTDRIAPGPGWDEWTLRVWDVKNKRRLARESHKHFLSALALSPDGKWLALAIAFGRHIEVRDFQAMTGPLAREKSQSEGKKTTLP
jgi:WD40 repeat protein